MMQDNGVKMGARVTTADHKVFNNIQNDYKTMLNQMTGTSHSNLVGHQTLLSNPTLSV